MRFFWSVLFLTLCGSADLRAGGLNLMVVPSRAVLTDQDRSAAFVLTNSSTIAATLELSFVNLEMDGEGRVREAPGAPAAITEQLLVGPDTTHLEPGESQVFRVLLSHPEKLQPGEYRIHLLFRNLTSESEVALKGPVSEAAGALAPTVFGLAVPLIIRHQTTPSHVTIQGLSLQGGAAPTLNLALVREGQQSVFGDFRVSLIPRSGAEILLANIKGIAVYTSQKQRQVQIRLPGTPWPADGRLVVTFHAQDQVANAQADLLLGH